MSLVVWEDRYLIGIDQIDEQHKQLIRLTNELYRSCMGGDNAAKEGFSIAMHGTVDYVKTHFAFEEAMLSKAAYPYITWHKREHGGFIKQILEDSAKFDAGEKFIPNKFVRFLRDWVLSHIAVADKSYAAFILRGDTTPPPGFKGEMSAG
jgi:hemerythrin